MSLIIHAPNVHRGGGRTLLLSLLQATARSGGCLVLADDRLATLPLPENTEVIRFPPSVAGRLAAERFLRARAQPADVVLCMGNLPPLFQLRARRTVLFIQNRYLLDAVDTSAFDAIVRLRIAIERLWLRRTISRVQQILVQSPSMADAVHRCLDIRSEVAPFALLDSGHTAPVTKDSPGDAGTAGFLYVASGEPHKNHRRLVEAWLLLAEAGIRPLLRLTLNTAHHPELAAWITASSEHSGLRIENSGEVSPEQLARLYKESAAL
ncbi:MAG: glycosyltransferase, partial [Burkholderiales bacterium]|nr:glycosyltransferase [Burkholderiales bacterium]